MILSHEMHHSVKRYEDDYCLQHTKITHGTPSPWNRSWDAPFGKHTNLLSHFLSAFPLAYLIQAELQRDRSISPYRRSLVHMDWTNAFFQLHPDMLRSIAILILPVSLVGYWVEWGAVLSLVLQWDFDVTTEISCFGLKPLKCMFLKTLKIAWNSLKPLLYTIN